MQPSVITTSPSSTGSSSSVDDYLSTTAVVTYVRKHVTPTMLWSAIGALVTTLVVCITWIVNYQSDMRQFKEALAEDKKAYADMQQRLDTLQDIKTQLAVMSSQIANIADEEDRQREWREHIEGVAEAPPHARRRR